MPVVKYFPYFGPNRRSDKPLVEVMLTTEPENGQRTPIPPPISDIRKCLQSEGVLAADETFPEQPLPPEPLASYASMLVQTALLFQRKTGHRVNWFSVSVKPDQDRCSALLEHEHCDVGMTAIKLADELISGRLNSFEDAFRIFSKFSRERLLSLETEAIIKAARRRDIPCVQLDRYPFSRDKNRPICVRHNGLLMLGHGPLQHLLDGTFCLDKSGGRLKAMLKNRSQRKALLERLGLPHTDIIEGEETDNELIKIFVINGRVTAIVNLSYDRVWAVEELHPSLLDLCVVINREVNGFPIVVTLQTPDPTKSLTETLACCVGFELGPDLEPLAGQSCPDSKLLDKTASALVEWLFPLGERTRIPIIAVTGTNGKTTTTRMIYHIMMAAGHSPGMVNTDGIYENGKQVTDTDAGTLIGHSNLLISTNIDIAVLESHHKGIFTRGFAFQWCDVAVCLNVTVDHLDNERIRSVEEMAVVKRALLERARYGAVLNADNQHCLNMLEHMVAEKTCLVSMQSDITLLKARTSDRKLVFCVLETVDGHDWVVIYDEVRLPVVQVNLIPATFDGLALFNVSNAMHAVAASYLAGIELVNVKSAMTSFDMSFENTPGRLNFYDGHPFRVLMDFAHNEDGMHQLSDFVGRLAVSGRKVLMLQAKGHNDDEDAMAIASAAAGYFDYYICRTHPVHPGPDKHKTPAALKAGLLKSGVSEHQIKVITDPVYAVDVMLKMGAEGDLLVFTPGVGKFDTWEQVVSFNSEITNRPEVS